MECEIWHWSGDAWTSPLILSLLPKKAFPCKSIHLFCGDLSFWDEIRWDFVSIFVVSLPRPPKGMNAVSHSTGFWLLLLHCAHTIAKWQQHWRQMTHQMAVADGKPNGLLTVSQHDQQEHGLAPTFLLRESVADSVVDGMELADEFVESVDDWSTQTESQMGSAHAQQTSVRVATWLDSISIITYGEN
jgi:hypothetical protein